MKAITNILISVFVFFFGISNSFAEEVTLPLIGLTLAANSDGLRTTDYFINHKSLEPFYDKNGLSPRVNLHLREVVAMENERKAAEENKVLLFIHGGTFPGPVAFDLDYQNVSMMRQFAKRGWDTFALSLEGYGMSTRPASMDNPEKYANSKAPISEKVTIANVARVVDFIRDLRGVDKVHLLGWSSGAMIEAPMYTITSPEKIAKLVLYAPKYLGKGKPKTDEEIKAIIEKRNRQKNRLGNPSDITRWAKLGTKSEYLIPGAFDAYTKAHLASDPKSKQLNGKIRAPWGRFMNMARPRYDAAQIKVPTLIIRGEMDTLATLNDNQALLDRLGSKTKKIVTIPDAGHMLHFEKTNKQFYAALQNFLETN